MRSLIRRATVMAAAAGGAGVLATGMLVTATGATGVVAASATVTAVQAPLPANAFKPQPEVTLRSVSCASAGNCTAVGDYFDRSVHVQGLLLTETSGTWATGVEAPLPANAGSTGFVRAEMSSVSCASAGNCTAVGIYRDRSGHIQGLLLSQISGTWATGVEAVLPPNAGPNPLQELDSVSCASAGNCTAVGDYFDRSVRLHGLLLSETSGTWAAGVEAVLPANANAGPDVFVSLDSVSCASAGNCAAVGYYNDRSGNRQGVLLSQASGRWAAGVEAVLPANAGPDPLAFLDSVSCASAGDCAAAGDYADSSGGIHGVLLSQTSGRWAAGMEAVPPANAPPGAFVSLDSVSCASAGNCTAAGQFTDQVLLLSETSGTWARGVEAVLPANAGPDPIGGGGAPVSFSVSCASAGNCTAVGAYADRSGVTHGLLLSQTSGRWAAGVEAPVPANAAPNVEVFGLSSVSCAAAGNCTAVGNYNSTSGFQGLLLSQTSPTCSGLTIVNQALRQTGTPGRPGRWLFTVSAQNCTRGGLQAMKLQGGTVGWVSGASATTSPATGTVRIRPHPKNHGQTVTWSGFPLASGASASITARVSGTVPKGAACGSSLPISGPWSATGRDASNTTVSSGPSTAATIRVTC